MGRRLRARARDHLRSRDDDARASGRRGRRRHDDRSLHGFGGSDGSRLWRRRDDDRLDRSRRFFDDNRRSHGSCGFNAHGLWLLLGRDRDRDHRDRGHRDRGHWGHRGRRRRGRRRRFGGHGRRCDFDNALRFGSAVSPGLLFDGRRTRRWRGCFQLRFFLECLCTNDRLVDRLGDYNVGCRRGGFRATTNDRRRRCGCSCLRGRCRRSVITVFVTAGAATQHGARRQLRRLLRRGCALLFFERALDTCHIIRVERGHVVVHLESERSDLGDEVLVRNTDLFGNLVNAHLYIGLRLSFARSKTRASLLTASPATWPASFCP